jgi:hypothetical protein
VTFWFDTAQQSWAVDAEDEPVPRSRVPFAVAAVVCAGASAAALALQFLGG